MRWSDVIDSARRVWYHHAVHMTKVEEGSQSIDRAARILVRLVESDDAVTLTGVMEETQLPKTTAARLLRALERNGLAQRRRGGGFRPGPVLVEYARRDSAVGDLATLALPLPRAPRRRDGRDDEHRDPDAGRGRAPRAGRQQPPARGRQLGRPADPDPRLVDGQGVHGVRRGAAAVRTPRAARAQHDHLHRRRFCRARGGAPRRLRDDVGGARRRALLRARRRSAAPAAR